MIYAGRTVEVLDDVPLRSEEGLEAAIRWGSADAVR
jgi:hypothetical protein